MLIRLVLDGCESELELWGYTDVFTGPEFADARRQVRVHVGGQSYRLDLVLEPERLNIELDGRKYHGGPAQWERDIARDRAVARVGYQTLRFSHDQLHEDPVGWPRCGGWARVSRRSGAKPGAGRQPGATRARAKVIDSVQRDQVSVL